MSRPRFAITPDHTRSSPTSQTLTHLTLGALIGGLILATPSPAHADTALEVSGGRLDWGLRDSFVNYVSGPIAGGDTALSEGLSTQGGEFRFHSATGDYASNGELTIAYQGRVHFTGHERDDGSFELDLAIANPTVEVTDSAATLYVDIDSPDGSITDVEFAELELDASTLADETSTVAAGDINATLTTSGAESFAGFYEPGEELDSLSFSGDLAAPAEEAEAEEDSEALPSAVLDWGVRDTWRDFVSGDIANGGWDVDGSAEDGGAVFRFIETDARSTDDDFNPLDIELAFTGEVTFWGTDIDLTLADPHLVIDEEHGEITALINDERLTLATFTPEWTENDGQLLLAESPTELTDEAVDSFHGFYQDGDSMAPLSVTVPMEPGANAPDLPDLGSEPDIDNTAKTESNPGNFWLVIAAATALTVIIAGFLLWVLRSRKPMDPTSQTTSFGGSPTENDHDDAPSLAPDTKKTKETE